MSRLYDTVEPAVIDDDMLQKTVEEQGPKGEAGRIAKTEGIDLDEVDALRLDFKNILKIDNLWCFTNLTKLQLDNNIIEKIEGLDLLTNLVWLDLSFNNIEVIEGLDKLTKLEDLTLYNNRISRIENMDHLQELHVFSVGNNDLKDQTNLVYLRRFKHLQTLNLSGNPLCELEEYKQYVIAHLPSLEYLDYRMVDEASKEAAYQKYEIAIQEIQHDEKQLERKTDEKEEKDKEFQLHKMAYVENLNGSYLFDTLYSEDAEGQKLNHMPGVEDLVNEYKNRFTTICKEIFEYGLKKQEERKAEVATFWECIEEAKQENKEMGQKKIDAFIGYKKKIFTDMHEMSEGPALEDKMEEFNKETDQLWDDLMGYELQLVDQLEDAIKDFERNIADMVGAFIENVQGLLSQCRDLENQHHERMLEISIVTLEKVVKNELDEDMPDDVRELFVDKDTIINAVTSSHDIHLLKIDNREDEVVTRINQWMSSMIDEIHETQEIQRNRGRIVEIQNFIDQQRDDLEQLEPPGAGY